MSRRLLERYVVSALLPYFLLALAILTVILLTQQTAKFAEIMGSAHAPLGMAAEVMLGILPNILVFTIPMAVLVGAATGFSRMGSDSELVAMRAAGVGTLRIIAPVLFIGALLSVATLYVGFEIAPAAAQDLRDVALRAALYKLESPVEPRSFYTDLPGKVVYVRDGDKDRGQWGRVFIYWSEQSGQVRIVTARSGRIDTSGEQSELVLSDAVVTHIPAGGLEAVAKGAQMTTEHSALLRLRDDRLNSGRNALMRRLQEREPELDEMGWQQLWERSQVHDPFERRNAAVAMHKRLSLCMSPLMFAFFGAGLGLRMRRGGRGVGILLSLVAMIFYYLVSLAGEQMGRRGTLPPQVGAWLAFGLSALIGLHLIILSRQRAVSVFRAIVSSVGRDSERRRGRDVFKWGHPVLSGLLDRTLLRSLALNFLGVLTLMVAVFQIFTLFELLRFVSLDGNSYVLLMRYLLFLTPLVCVSVMPLSTLVAVLITYSLVVRRSEAVAWWASGQSIYRLILPALLFAVVLGWGGWHLQENVMPAANRRQNALRGQIRSGAARIETPLGRQWLATGNGKRIYSYEYDERIVGLRSPDIYEFDDEGVHITRLISGDGGKWNRPVGIEIASPRILELQQERLGRFFNKPVEVLEDSETQEGFKPSLNLPAEMNSTELSQYLKLLNRRGGSSMARTYSVALERKRSDPFSMLVMVLIGSPLAFSFGRRSTITALCVSVGVGLMFWGGVSGFQQLAASGLLPPTIAAWGPLVIFASLGLYFLSRSKT